MSDRQRKKGERRQRRLEKRKRQQVIRETKLEAVTCQNCGDRFGHADDPDVIHRSGPCDCTPQIRKAMDAFLDARADAFENAPGKRLACVTCGVMHDESEQATCFFEGRLVWDGCDTCYEAQAAKFEAIREEHRFRWFGVRLEPVAEIAVPVPAASKYMPPLTSSGVTSVYAGAPSQQG